MSDINEWNQFSVDSVHSSNITSTFTNRIDKSSRKGRIPLDSCMRTLHKLTASLSEDI